ncbi:hypothetical protein NQ315_012334 [Exocentrus adspersus]|uniref:Transposase n=1 Tax=Exocentrus adspersus TaxID=1586481 RepID=A0AAV8V896_9CUCU|nr:hypothetical protein NQ315_012334 [Exocentrus adspersus]
MKVLAKDLAFSTLEQNLWDDSTNFIADYMTEISDEISISKSVVHRTLKKNNFYPYHPEHHQFLTEQDCQKRVQFCEWVLFTDESSFANTGRENRHNYHHYADQNPRVMRQDDHQHRFKVNVWAGICGEYRHIPPDDLNSQWFQHDGAPAHSTLVRILKNGLYPDKWIGSAGSIPWPPRSPDLSCLDFFYGAVLKTRCIRLLRQM